MALLGFDAVADDAVAAASPQPPEGNLGLGPVSSGAVSSNTGLAPGVGPGPAIIVPFARRRALDDDEEDPARRRSGLIPARPIPPAIAPASWRQRADAAGELFADPDIAAATRPPVTPAPILVPPPYPYLDHAAGASFTGAASGAVTLSTFDPQDVIVVCVFAEQSALCTVTSVSDTLGLTWQQRGGVSDITGRPVDLEVWWAFAPAALVADQITVHWSAAPDDWSVLAFGVHNCNTPDPWGAYAPATEVGTSSSVAPSVNVNAASYNFVIAVVGDSDNQTSDVQAPPTGFPLIGYQQNLGGAEYSQLGVAGKGQVGALSGAVTWGSTMRTGLSHWLYYVDVLLAAAPAMAPARRQVPIEDDEQPEIPPPRRSAGPLLAVPTFARLPLPLDDEPAGEPLPRAAGRRFTFVPPLLVRPFLWIAL